MLFAFLRPSLLRLFTPRDNLDNFIPSLKTMGITPFLKYTTASVFVHSLALLSIEFFSFSGIWLLLLRVLKIDHIREKSDFLLGNLPFFFIPAVVSIMNYVDVIAKNLVPFLVICVVSLVLTYGATAWAVQLTMKLMKKGGEKK